MALVFGFLFGLIIKAATTTTPVITQLLACSNGSLPLPGVAVNVNHINEFYREYRYFDHTDWIVVEYCNRFMAACVVKTPVLADGTRVSSGANGSLIVGHLAQSSSRNHIQFLSRVRLTNGSDFRHIFRVNFTVTCLETWKDANFNLTNLMHNMFPLERVIEIELFDTNGTKFAYLNPGLGATVNVTDVHRQMPYFWKRLTVTADGSLILNRLQMRDNRLEIRAIAHLTSLKRKMNPKRAGRSSMESISAKTIRFLVNDGKSSQGPSILPPSKSSSSHLSSSSSPHTTVPASSSILPTTVPGEWWAPTMPSGASSVRGQLSTVISAAVVTVLSTNLR